MGQLLGYARVSTADQRPQLQLDALKAGGCFRVFVDKASGVLDERPQLLKVLDQVRPGDTLVDPTTRARRTGLLDVPRGLTSLESFVTSVKAPGLVCQVDEQAFSRT